MENELSTGVAEPKGGFFDTTDVNGGEPSNPQTEANATPGETGEASVKTEETPAGKETIEPAKELGAVPDDFSKMTDEQIEKLVARLTESTVPHNKKEPWQRILKQRDISRERAKTAFEKLAVASPESAKEMLLDQGYSEFDADKVLDELGANRTEGSHKPELKPEDDTEFLALMNGMGVEYDSLTPEQRQFWKFQFQFNRQMMKPVDEFIKTQKTDRVTQEQKKVYDAVQKDHESLVKHIKDEFGLEMGNPIEGVGIEDRMDEYLQDHPTFVGTPTELFYVSHRQFIKDMGKRAAEKETAKLNEDKKKAKSEQPGSTGKNQTVGEKSWLDFFKG